MIKYLNSLNILKLLYQGKDTQQCISSFIRARLRSRARARFKAKPIISDLAQGAGFSILK